MLLGAIGGFIAFGLQLTRIYAVKYANLSAAASLDPYRRALLGDDLFIIGLPMLLSGRRRDVDAVCPHVRVWARRRSRVPGRLPAQAATARPLEGDAAHVRG